MEVNGDYRIDAPREKVFAALNDPAVLARCIPGCESLEQADDDAWRGRIKAAVGPVRATFDALISIEDRVPPASYTLRGDAKAGAAGFGRGSARVSLEESAAGGTDLHYVADFSVGGKLAQVGNRLVAGTTKKTADQFFAKLAREFDDTGACGDAVDADAAETGADADSRAHRTAASPPTATPASRKQRAMVLAVIAGAVAILVWFLGTA